MMFAVKLLGWAVGGLVLWIGFLAMIELAGRIHQRKRRTELDEHDPYYEPTVWRRK